MSKPQLFLIRPYGTAIEQAALKALDGMEQTAVVPISYEDLARASAHQAVGLAVAHVTERKDGVDLVQLLKVLRAKLATEHWQILVITPFKQQIFKEKLLKYGATEVLIEPVPDKSLQFKIKRLMQSLIGRTAGKLGTVHSSDAAAGKAGRRIGPTAEREAGKPQASPIAKKAVVEWLPALESSEDVFSLKGGAARFVRARWEIKLMGPPKALGEWIKLENDAWRWVFRDAISSGAWVFKGQKPAYQQGAWVFTGAAAELSYQDGGDTLLRKFFVQDGHRLHICKDGSDVSAIQTKMRESAKALKSTDASEAPVRISREVDAEEFDLESGERRVVRTVVEEVQEAIATPDHDDLKELRQEVEAAVPAQSPRASSSVGSSAVEPGAAQEDALTWILKRDVPGPALSPLALAFLVTEWMARSQMDQRDALARVARYVSASLGRAKVEIWAEESGQWGRVVGLGSEPEWMTAESVQSLLKQPDSEGARQRAEWVSKSGASRTAIVVGDGRVAHATVGSYLKDVAQLLVGVVALQAPGERQ